MVRTVAIVALMTLAIIASGCIRSTMYITSTPSGAEVTVNDARYGRTPVDVSFAWYWYYKIKVEKKGYTPVESMEHLRTPLWAIMPLDLIAETIPYPIPDRRYLHYDLKPAPEM